MLGTAPRHGRPPPRSKAVHPAQAGRQNGAVMTMIASPRRPPLPLPAAAALPTCRKGPACGVRCERRYCAAARNPGSRGPRLRCESLRPGASAPLGYLSPYSAARSLARCLLQAAAACTMACPCRAEVYSSPTPLSVSYCPGLAYCPPPLPAPASKQRIRARGHL